MVNPGSHPKMLDKPKVATPPTWREEQSIRVKTIWEKDQRRPESECPNSRDQNANELWNGEIRRLAELDQRIA
jgi:hypothetical protein